MKKERYLEILVEESQSPNGVQLLDGVDEPIAVEWLARAVWGLNPDAGPRIVAMDNNNALGMKVFVAESDRL